MRAVLRKVIKVRIQPFRMKFFSMEAFRFSPLGYGHKLSKQARSIKISDILHFTFIFRLFSVPNYASMINLERLDIESNLSKKSLEFNIANI